MFLSDYPSDIEIERFNAELKRVDWQIAQDRAKRRAAAAQLRRARKQANKRLKQRRALTGRRK